MKKKTIAALASILILFIMVGVSLNWIHSKTLSIDEKYEEMNHHYIMISSKDNDAFWDRIYNSAYESGQLTGAYVERFGKDLTVSYDRQELLRLASQVSADGIIVEGDESDEMVELIDSIVESGIPVVTVMSDCSLSLRQCYVGVNSYDIGQIYGDQIIQLLQDRTEGNVLVTLSGDSIKTSDNLILLGIRERLEAGLPNCTVNVDVQCISNDSAFSTEEYFNTFFMTEEAFPTVLVCLDSLSTICAYQAAIDHNEVGSMYILGFDDSETVLSEIEKQVLVSTLSIDSEQIGASCVEALNDYLTTGYTNTYIAAEMELIDQKRAEQLLQKSGE